MRKLAFAALLALVLIAFALAQTPALQYSLRATPDAGNGLVTLTLTASNPGATAWSGTTHDAQVYDYAVYQGSKLVWQWSDGRFFAQVVTHMTIPPGGSVIHEQDWEVPSGLAAGTYRAVATFRPTGATATADFDWK